jgi:hypothetical protein
MQATIVQLPLLDVILLLILEVLYGKKLSFKVTISLHPHTSPIPYNAIIQKSQKSVTQD